MSYRLFKLISAPALFIVLTAVAAVSQTADAAALEIEVPIIRQTGSRNSGCHMDGNIIVTKDLYEKMAADKRCSAQMFPAVDFSTQTLLRYVARGDCFIHADASVLRSERKKVFTVHINNYWGRCRAGGAFSGFLIIDRIPDGYSVDFVEHKIDRIEENSNLKQSGSSDSILLKSEVVDPKQSGSSDSILLKSEPVDLKQCIPIYRDGPLVVHDRASYFGLIRKDAQEGLCRRLAPDLDFDGSSLIGFQINSGYCRRPRGLRFWSIMERKTNRLILKIRYSDPKREICRALSRYDLWVRLPKIDPSTDVVIDLSPE